MKYSTLIKFVTLISLCPTFLFAGANKDFEKKVKGFMAEGKFLAKNIVGLGEGAQYFGVRGIQGIFESEEKMDSTPPVPYAVYKSGFGIGMELAMSRLAEKIGLSNVPPSFELKQDDTRFITKSFVRTFEENDSAIPQEVIDVINEKAKDRLNLTLLCFDTRDHGKNRGVLEHYISLKSFQEWFLLFVITHDPDMYGGNCVLKWNGKKFDLMAIDLEKAFSRSPKEYSTHVTNIFDELSKKPLEMEIRNMILNFSEESFEEFKYVISDGKEENAYENLIKRWEVLQKFVEENDNASVNDISKALKPLLQNKEEN